MALEARKRDPRDVLADAVPLSFAGRVPVEASCWPDRAYARKERSEVIERALARCSAQTQTVMGLRYGWAKCGCERCKTFPEQQGGHTLREIGLVLGLSPERIRQIEQKALRSIRRALLAAGHGDDEDQARRVLPELSVDPVAVTPPPPARKPLVRCRQPFLRPMVVTGFGDGLVWCAKHGDITTPGVWTCPGCDRDFEDYLRTAYFEDYLRGA